MITSDCPECGAEIQSTTKEWRSGLTIELDDDGNFVEIINEGWLDDGFTSHVYCKNDHTIMEA